MKKLFALLLTLACLVSHAQSFYVPSMLTISDLDYTVITGTDATFSANSQFFLAGDTVQITGTWVDIVASGDFTVNGRMVLSSFVFNKTHDFPSIPANGSLMIPAPTLSTASNDICLVGAENVPGIEFSCYVTSQITANIVARNVTTAAIDPPVRTFKVRVIK